MTFSSRETAGRRLGEQLLGAGVRADLVLGLPRGGVVVAAEVARALNRPLDAIIVRKIGHPLQREYAVGALAEPDVFILDQGLMYRERGLRAKVEAIIAEETQRLVEYRVKFHLRPAPELRRRAVLIVDDGLATGATAEAAVLAARQRGAANVMVAAPVAATTAVERLKALADEVHVLLADPDFSAVGRYYLAFEPTPDATVLDLLRAGGNC